MKCAVILAAGKSTRTYPLTVQRPKPMLNLCNRSVMEHHFEQLRLLGITEIVIIVGFEKNKIKNKFGSEWEGLKINYAEQAQASGTADALLQAKPFISDRFLLINGDDLVFANALAPCLTNEWCVMTSMHPDAARFGQVMVSGELVSKILEKEDPPKSKLVSTGVYSLTPEVFELLPELSPEAGKLEVYVPDAVNKMISSGVKFHSAVTDSRGWIPLTFPWDVVTATGRLFEEFEHSDIKGTIDESAIIEGPVVVSAGATVYQHAHIVGPAVVGPRATVGAHAVIRRSTLGEAAIVSEEAVVENSVLYDRSSVSALADVANSVIGEGAVVGEGAELSDSDENGENIRSHVKGEMVDTGLKKLGCILGDQAYLGVGVRVKPGIKIYPRVVVADGEEVLEDISN